MHALPLQNSLFQPITTVKKLQILFKVKTVCFIELVRLSLATRLTPTTGRERRSACPLKGTDEFLQTDQHQQSHWHYHYIVNVSQQNLGKSFLCIFKIYDSLWNLWVAVFICEHDLYEQYQKYFDCYSIYLF